MIHFVAPEEGRFGIDDYLASSWSGSMHERIRQITYPELFGRTSLPRGTWIFAGLDQLTPSGLKIAGQVWQNLAAGGQERLLNHPFRVLKRYDLLSTLHRAGINRFRAIRVHESWNDLRFPVFLREENYHTGSISGVVKNRAELRRELRWARFRGFRLSDLLIVEFCDTSGGTGFFRKYSAFKIGEAILARYLNISRNWMVKAEQGVADEGSAMEERRYVRENPHEPWLRRVFKIAQIDYGRMDYGLCGDAPQVWEINTNPRITASRSPRIRTAEEALFREQRQPGREHFHELFARAWKAVDSGSDGPEIPFYIPPELSAQWRAEAAVCQSVQRSRLLRVRLAANPLIRAIRSRLEPSTRRVIQCITPLPAEVRQAAGYTLHKPEKPENLEIPEKPGHP